MKVLTIINTVVLVGLVGVVIITGHFLLKNQKHIAKLYYNQTQIIMYLIQQKKEKKQVRPFEKISGEHEDNLTAFALYSQAKVYGMKVQDVDTGRYVQAFYLEKYIGPQGYYKEVVRYLKNAKKGEKVYIYLVKNGGGYSSGADYIIDGIRKSKAEVTIIVNGYAYSAAANIFCTGDKLYMTRKSRIGYHMAQYISVTKKEQLTLSTIRKMGEIKQRLFMTEFCNVRGILSKDDINTIINIARPLKATDHKPFVFFTEAQVRAKVLPQYKDWSWK